MEDGMKKSIKLFKVFFKLGFFAFGGGYSMIPLIQREVVENEKIIEKEEFLDIISVAEGLPGAIGLNTSIFIGFIVNRYVGAIMCAAASILPSVILVTGIMTLFAGISDNAIVQKAFYGIRPIVVALIGYASIKISLHAYKYKWYMIFTAIAFYFSLEHVMEIPYIVICGFILGIVVSFIEEKINMKKYNENQEELEENIMCE